MLESARYAPLLLEDNRLEPAADGLSLFRAFENFDRDHCWKYLN